MSQIPKELIEKYRIFLGKEIDLFIHSCSQRPLKAIRINTLKYKKDAKEIEYFKKNKIELKKIEYLKNSYIIASEVSGLGNSIEQLLGYFHMQEISSMLPVMVLDPKPGEIVLDMAAAPGNKSSMIVEYMENHGLLIANDLDKKRIKKLIYTLKKNGVTNTLVTCEDACKLKINNIKFDKILLDAPCSCEGFLFKKNKSLESWSQKLVLSRAVLQKKLLQNAFELLKPGGAIVYSTCTLSPEENEEVVDYLLKNPINKEAYIEEIKINNLNYSSGLTEYNTQKYDKALKKAIRIYTHKTNLESFFICKIRKKGKEENK